MIIDQKNFQPLLYKSADKQKVMKFKILVPILWKSKKKLLLGPDNHWKVFFHFIPIHEAQNIDSVFIFRSIFQKSHFFQKYDIL